MDLQDFVSQALSDIVNGVKKAQELAGAGVICPDGLETDDAVKAGISTISPVEFQVSVRTDERKGSEAKLSVVAAIVGGHVKGESGSNSGHVATLSFRVPVRFPRSKA
jgi:hypothetical protein